MSFFSLSVLRNNNMWYKPNIINTLLIDTTKVIQVRAYAARKGTRERKAKAKVKKVVEKVGFIPHNLRNKDKLLLNRKERKFDDSWRKIATDNVYCAKYFRFIVYPFGEAVAAHRETHHPEVYNKPDANIHVSIELNMQAEKKTRFVENFKRIVAIPHKFDHGEDRNIIAFCKNPDLQKEAAQAGAQLSGGVDLIKQIQNGQVNLQDFQYVVAHPDILPELVPLRGIMKRRFPNPKSGTLDINLGSLVDKYLNGISYSATKDEYEKDFGIIETIIGRLNMEAEHLEDNFAALVRDVYSVRPKREGDFISRCLLWSPPSREKLKVDHNLYIDRSSKDKEIPDKDDEVLDELDDEEKLKATV